MEDLHAMAKISQHKKSVSISTQILKIKGRNTISIQRIIEAQTHLLSVALLPLYISL